MLKENELVGVIGIYRQEVRPFTDKQIELVKNFAAQAVIAIENARLLNELQCRSNSQQQTAPPPKCQGHQPSTFDSADGARHARRMAARSLRTLIWLHLSSPRTGTFLGAQATA